MNTKGVSSTSDAAPTAFFAGGHVLKFGGSSVGTPQSIRCVKDIVENCQYPIIVVVSALGGVTDQLIALSHEASRGGDAYRQGVEALRTRHYEMIAEVIAPAPTRYV